MVLTVAEAKKLTVPRLKEELTKRGLDSTGNKPELLSRLTESIHQAAEDAILNDAGSAADQHHLLNEDILNDDFLDAPIIDGEDEAEKLLGGAVESTESVVEEAKNGETPAEEKQEIISTEKKVDGGVEDAQRARAIRFGLPLTSEALGSDSAKAARGKRFGLPADAKQLASDDAKAKRAERFGITAEAPITASDEKMAARAARFGLPVHVGAAEQAEKLAARAKRFGAQHVDDEETAAKKQARLERFGSK